MAFQRQLLLSYLVSNRQQKIYHVDFWPRGKRFALVLTHDVEAAPGQRFVGSVADLEEKHGFRSCFNFVAADYAVDRSLLADLQQRGFEVGVHGLKHDGSLFSSRAEFDKQVLRINECLRAWNAVGFRAPMTHRNPAWMQSLEIEYDSSFFDTDPYEPIPGGTMSIWPFQMGHFIELPYTLAQDHTLMNTLGARSPRLWLEKVEFIRQYWGMALVNVHPDYMRRPAYLAVYEDFLRQMQHMEDYWHALPRDVARWWRNRSQLDVGGNESALRTKLPGATIGTILRAGGGLEIVNASTTATPKSSHG